VFNNNAPDAPGGITVPENVLGGESLTVTWSAASDPDDNLTGYELERQVDGGEWAQVYKGADTSYTDNITRGWQSINYERDADMHRARILQFNTELLRNAKHTEEDFNEILYNIDCYERYCREHPEYQNNRAVHAIKHIMDVYDTLQKTHDFPVHQGQTESLWHPNLG